MSNNWYGDLPSGWALKRLKNYVFEINETNKDLKTDNILSLTNKLGVVPYSEKGNQGNTAKESLDGYKIAYSDTIVCNSMNVLIGSVGISKYYGCVSPVYYVYKAKDNANLEFINYIFQTEQFQKELRRYANGILEIRLRVSSQDILRREIPIPSLDEQDRIVNAIKEKEEKIKALIRNEEAQIEKLKSYKQSLISETVTKGLDPNVPMKDSGIAELGEVPSSWFLTRAKYVFTEIKKGSGITKEQIVVDGDTPCIRYGEIYSKYDLSFTNCCSRTNVDLIESKQFACKDDILFAGTGELVEEIGKNIVYLGDEKILVGGDIIIISHKQNPKFLSYALYCSASQKQKSKGKAKLKVVHISPSEIGNVVIAVPNIIEQEKIVEYLDKKITLIDKLIFDHEQKINKLNSYKKSLIYEYVTGKRLANEQ